MLFFYIRHGDPTYSPDSLTPLGERQAEAVAKRLALYGVDTVYASTSERAILTAKPTCELLKKELHTLDFANEKYAAEQLTADIGHGPQWIFQQEEMREWMAQSHVRYSWDEWYKHPALEGLERNKGIERIYEESDRFFLSLGYEHVRGTGKYKVVKPNDERVALFAHQGFGLAFLSCVLDIPYPMFINHFDMCHTGVTVIEFKECDGYSIPKVLSLSGDSHLYKEGLPTNYNNSGVRF